MSHHYEEGTEPRRVVGRTEGKTAYATGVTTAAKPKQNNKERFEYDYAMPSATASTIPYFYKPTSGYGARELHIVLIKRGNEPEKGKYAIPGGFLEVGKEDLKECAVRELREEVSIIADASKVELVTVQSAPDRDPRGHVIDNVFCVEINEEQLLSAKAGDDAAELKLVNLNSKNKSIIAYAFDHKESVKVFFDRFNRSQYGGKQCNGQHGGL